ncbi:hypothetical protein BS47DRAFT_1314494 [Hydnum rufescens UP504]|uniref:Mucoidy inhibitor A n=1 Tax=Hydnum rufescens UP504 TaxID=1448309 RepID=A0A9P6B453_9AGAM|nr:hypothetical protein BS47DRAFT_1314494 [Hydnum rufescens UP504]
MANGIKINAPEHDIEQVTVYGDRAVIRRKFPVELQAGQNEAVVSRLPASLESDSIRVETETTSASQSLTVFDVVYAPPGSPQNVDEGDEISSLEERVSAVQSRHAFLTKQEKVLSSYSDTLSSQYANASQLASFLDLQRTTNRSIYEERTALDKEYKSLSKELDDARKRTNSEIQAKRASSVTVTVLSEEPGPAQLILIYAVYGASWSSLYDVRASVDSHFASKKAESPTISLQYRASITQHTGEDWNGVALILSTAAPLIGSEIPELVPWSIAPTVAPRPMLLSAPRVRTMARMVKSARSVEDDDEDMGTLRSYEISKQFGSRSRAVVVQEGAVSSVFHIEGQSTIPSDDLSHKVSIAVLDLAAEFEWVTVPRKVTSAYLKCRVKNTSDFLLIRGPSNVFMDGNFVSKSSIPSVSPQETFSCSLGVDPSLRITYHPQKKSVSTTGGSLLSRSQKTDVTAYWQRISIKNTRPTTISRLIVKDQVPTSENARIKVLLTDPNEKQIGPMDPASTNQSTPFVSRAQINDGIVARWAQKNEDGTGGPKGDGIIEWVCTDVGEELDINLAYEVSAPQNVPWS